MRPQPAEAERKRLEKDALKEAREERRGNTMPPMLPPLLFADGDGMCTIEMPLMGIVRRKGRISKDESAPGARNRLVAAAPAPAADAATRLRELAAKLRGSTASTNSFPRRWQASVQTLMSSKSERYQSERAALQYEIDDAQAKAASFVRQARSGGLDALADENTGKWEVAKEVANRWQALVQQAVALDRVILTARQRADTISTTTDFAWQRLDLAHAIEQLVADYTTQTTLLGTLADLVDGFVNQPLVASATMLNLVIMGNAGAGKTRLATALAAVLGKLGLFAYDALVLAGRSDFVAEYEGQTAIKARSFLLSNLEKCIFLDEAYSLTTWELEQGGARTLSSYSAEAATELVAYLSQRVGSGCFIAAGYEREMLYDFLPANPGLSRRFPYRVWMRDYTASELVEIFLGALAEALSDPSPAPPLTSTDTRTYFTKPALAFLADVLRYAMMQQDANSLLKQTFASQAGAMVTLANSTALLVASHPDRARIGLSSAGYDTWAIGLEDAFTTLTTMINNLFGPRAERAIDEVRSIAMERGWLTNENVWQVPPSSAATTAADDDHVATPPRSTSRSRTRA